MSKLYSNYIKENMVAKGIDVDTFKKKTKLSQTIIKALEEDRCKVDAYIAKQIAKAFGQCWKVWLQLADNLERKKNEN